MAQSSFKKGPFDPKGGHFDPKGGQWPHGTLKIEHWQITLNLKQCPGINSKTLDIMPVLVICKY